MTATEVTDIEFKRPLIWVGSKTQDGREVTELSVGLRHGPEPAWEWPK